MSSWAAWIRKHPKTSGITAAAVVLVAVAGAVGNQGADEVAGQAVDHSVPVPTPTAAPLSSSSASPAAPKHTSSAPRTTKASPTRRVTQAAADRRQASSHGAVALLATLTVKGRAPMTGYSRAQFGPAWTDNNDDPSGHNGCDTRNDILHRDLTAISLKADSNGCTVLTGTLVSPYTAATIHFTRGQSTSTAVQIDHVVALGDAWQTGAQQWGPARRVDLANDPLNLLAVDGHSNEQKGDADAASWLPANTAYRCAYVARQVAVKARYGLSVTPAEHNAIAGILTRCPGQTVPTESGAPAAVHPAQPPPPATHAAAPPPPPRTTPPPPPTTVYYANCAAVRAAGKAPLHRGDPGYRSGLDRDGDGIACET